MMAFPDLRITYVARSFLDYRVPVLTELNRLCGDQLHYISSRKWTPERALTRLSSALGARAIYLAGERSLGVDVPLEANTSVCLPYQPGLLREISQTRPEVLLCDGFFQWTYAALLHRVLYGTPLVVCYERWAHTERNAQWYRRLYRRLALRFTGAVCCNGRLSAEYTRSLGFPADRITTGHMAADTARLAQSAAAVTPAERARLRASWQATGVVLLFVGQLIERKGLKELLSAWALLDQSRSRDATLVIVGIGPEEQNLKRQAQSLRLHQVHFAGGIDYDQLPPYYASADAFIIPTLEDNWSLVVPEAMACGLPVLCSKYNGCWPDLVQRGRNGWVFDPLTPADIVPRLKECLDQADRLGDMGRASSEVLKSHTPRQAAESILEACRIANSMRTHGVPASGMRRPSFL